MGAEDAPLIHRDGDSNNSIAQASEIVNEWTVMSGLCCERSRSPPQAPRSILSLSMPLCCFSSSSFERVQVLVSIPVNVNGLALGMVGLGVAWQAAAEILLLPPPLMLLSDLIALLTLNIAGTLVVLYIVPPPAHFQPLSR